MKFQGRQETEKEPTSEASPRGEIDKGQTRVLLVDGDERFMRLLSNILTLNGYRAIYSRSTSEALEAFAREAPDVVILNRKTPGMDGIEMLKRIKEMDFSVPVIMTADCADVKSAVEAVKLGACDYLAKPLRSDELLAVVERALKSNGAPGEPFSLKEELNRGASLEDILGRSAEAAKIIDKIGLVAPTDFTVVLEGETGVGKEVIANLIHHRSRRKYKPFVALDCGAIPETLIESELFGYEPGAFTGAGRRKKGYFELADGGTLFLDEIEGLPMVTQTKLLRALEERTVWRLGGESALPVDVRVIAATQVPLEEEIKQGRFREDLFYRLNEFKITIPPLRMRKDDILSLVRKFIDQANVELNKSISGLSPEAASVIMNYDWPGNIRELKNAVKQAVLLSSNVIEPGRLSRIKPPPKTPPEDPAPIKEQLLQGKSFWEIKKSFIQDIERKIIKDVMSITGGNKAKAAKILKVDYKTLFRKSKKYGI